MNIMAGMDKGEKIWYTAAARISRYEGSDGYRAHARTGDGNLQKCGRL